MVKITCPNECENAAFVVLTSGAIYWEVDSNNVYINEFDDQNQLELVSFPESATCSSCNEEAIVCVSK